MGETGVSLAITNFVCSGVINPLMSEPKSQNCRKLPYGGLAAVSPFVLRGLRLCATAAARAPALPKRADSSRAGRGCPLSLGCRPPLVACDGLQVCQVPGIPYDEGYSRWPPGLAHCGPHLSPAQNMYRTVAASACSLCYTPSLRHLPSFLTV